MRPRTHPRTYRGLRRWLAATVWHVTGPGKHHPNQDRRVEA